MVYHNRGYIPYIVLYKHKNHHDIDSMTMVYCVYMLEYTRIILIINISKSLYTYFITGTMVHSPYKSILWEIILFKNGIFNVGRWWYIDILLYSMDYVLINNPEYILVYIYNELYSMIIRIIHWIQSIIMDLHAKDIWWEREMGNGPIIR